MPCGKERPSAEKQMIYEGAHHVIAWLGVTNPHYRREDELHGGSPEECIGHDFTRGQVNQLCDEATRGRAWWSRIWIVQEMMVARYLFVSSGSQFLRWDEFVHATSEWRPIIESRHVELEEIVDRIQQLDRLRRNWWKPSTVLICFSYST